MEISFCPYRTQFSPSKVLYTAVSQPITFKSHAEDLELEAAREKEEREREQERGELLATMEISQTLTQYRPPRRTTTTRRPSRTKRGGTRCPRSSRRGSPSQPRRHRRRTFKPTNRGTAITTRPETAKFCHLITFPQGKQQEEGEEDRLLVRHSDGE